MMKSLSILIFVGLLVLPSGRALKCYQCSSDLNGDCAKPNNDKLQECVLTTSTSTTTTTTTTTITTTTEPTTTPEGSGAGGEGSGAGGEGSGAGGEGSGAGGAEGGIADGGEGVEVVSGDEGGEDNGDSASNPDSGTNQNGKGNVVPTRVSRAILHHSFSKQLYADAQPKMVCLKKITNTTVTRECGLDTEECKDNCYKCNNVDGCNSATSVAVYASMMFGLLAVVFMTR